MIRERLSTEFRLLAACCRWPASSSRDAEIHVLAGQRIDWTLLLGLARRHRVEGLVHRALTDAAAAIPIDVKAELTKEAASIGRQNLFQAAESLRLAKLFKQAGIRLLFVKGVTLAKLAFGTLGIKKAWDIDVLVDADRIGESAALLKQAGYERIEPGLEVPEERFGEWAQYCKESLWSHNGNGSVVELHSGLADNPRLIEGITAATKAEMVQIGSGITLATLPKDELFTYICVHGATHAWSRLKWLADVAALLGKEDDREIERLYRRSLELGAGRSSAQALLLCADLLGLALPETLDRELRRDRKTLWLCKVAVEAMAGRGATELDDTMFGTASIQLSHFLLGKGLRYKLTELRQKSQHPLDSFLMPLPKSLRLLYPVLAVPRWVWRRARLSRQGIR